MMTDSQPKTSPRLFIREFEGLRGILAAWVIFGHILLFSGFTYQDGWFGILFSPVLGVYAFMMLSGFVITAALDQRPATWTAFMSRRFFRLFPIYAVCLGLAIATIPVSVALSHSNTLAQFGPENLERLSGVQEHFWLYLFADATLLQCLLPQTLYPYASETFLPPTWSLTIEWLFYIVAPLLVWLINRHRKWALVAVSAFLVAIYLFRQPLAEWNPSFHLGNALHFLTGIGSYYLWKHLPDRTGCRWSQVAFWFVVLLIGVALSFPFKIWAAVMAVVMYPRFFSSKLFFLEWPRRCLNAAPLQFLGRISYVSYLLHWVVIELVLFWVMQLAPGVSDKYILAWIGVMAVYPLTYLASAILHRHIEVPMIRFGKSLLAKPDPILSTPLNAIRQSQT